MRHLVRVCLHEGRTGRGARNMVATRGISRQPAETIDKAQHIRHEYVGNGESPRQPFASSQNRLQIEKALFYRYNFNLRRFARILAVGEDSGSNSLPRRLADITSAS
jgi:hypothetical protein